jgi:hypothetical protein
MNKPTSFITSLLIICLLFHSVAAQSLSTEQATSPTAKVTIYRDLVRFAAVDAEQLRLELFDLSGNKIFDSGFVSSNSFDWLTHDQQGQPVDSSLFAYTLTVQGKGRAESLTQQGNVIIDRERQNLPDAPEIPGKRKRGEIQPQTAWVFDVNATGGSYNINTPLMGIGTANPLARLHVGAGNNPPSTSGSTLLVEEGAASSVVIKGTSGGEMLLSQDNAAGVFGTVSTHPLSIRTDNVNRIFVDTLGRVGIGTTTPTATLTVAGTIESSGGTLTGGAINTNSYYNINGNRIMSIAGGVNNMITGLGAGSALTMGFNNSFYGYSAGNLTTTGSNNAFFGESAGRANTTGGSNSFFGSGAGTSNTTGNGNAFFGDSAGRSNTIGGHNSFFGSGAGALNTTANFNSFFGRDAGGRNTTGDQNAFFGVSTGLDNTTGSRNAFFGRGAGRYNTTGSENSFFGKDAGYYNTTGTDNAFFGESAGRGNSTGSANAMFGASAGSGTSTGSNNAFFGAAAGSNNTEGSYNTFVGKDAGLHNTTAYSNSFFGAGSGQNTTTGTDNSFFGDAAGTSNTTGHTNVFMGSAAGLSNTIGFGNVFIGTLNGYYNSSGLGNTSIGSYAGSANTTGSFNNFLGYGADAASTNLSNATAIGARALVSQSNSIVLGSINGINGATATVNIGIGTTTPADRLDVNGGIRVSTLGLSGTTQLCRNGANQLSFCSSSLRYKNQIQPFNSGLALINQLRPVSFNWTAGGERDLGLVAEEVAEIEPLLVTHNEKGQVEGIKYDRINVALVNAVKELRAEKDAQLSKLMSEHATQMSALQKQNTALSERLAAIEKQLSGKVNKKPDSLRIAKTSGRHNN